MKKILSCVLAIALVFSLMSMTVFAGRIVGNEGQGINNGVDTFDQKSDSQQDVSVNFNVSAGNTNEGTAGETTLIHRYAIDITYATLMFDLTQTKTTITIDDDEELVYQVWDVNEYEYVECIKNDAGEYVTVEDAQAAATDPSTTDTETTAGTLTIENAFYVTNHSDLDVQYRAVLTNSQVANIEFDFNDGTNEFAQDGDTVTVNFTTIGAVKYGDGAAKDSPKYALNANPVSSWNETINALQPAAGTSTHIVGNIVITVKPAA